MLNDIFPATMSKSNFTFHYVIGRGGFGKVSIFISSSYRSSFIMKLGVAS
jgi:hypothetical protein